MPAPNPMYSAAAHFTTPGNGVSLKGTSFTGCGKTLLGRDKRQGTTSVVPNATKIAWALAPEGRFFLTFPKIPNFLIPLSSDRRADAAWACRRRSMRCQCCRPCYCR
jgi:hypothetical protein